MMKFIKILLSIIFIVVFYLIISDWDNFKRGLMGDPPVENQEIMNQNE